MNSRATKIAKDIFAWQDILSDYHLPIDDTIKNAALQKLKSPTGNAKNIAAIMVNDPALCLPFFAETNKIMHRADNETKSLANALSLLGFPKVESMLRQTNGYTNIPTQHLSKFRQQLSVSLHAAKQAEAWAYKNPYWPAGELFWAALFQRAPLWGLWIYAGDDMCQWEAYRAKRHGASHPDIERDFFGTTLKELCNSVSISWHLPKHSQKSWQTKYRGSIKQWGQLANIPTDQTRIALESSPKLQRLCSTPAFAVSVCNSLAEEAEWNWYSHRTYRLQKLLGLVSHRQIEEGIAISHQASASSHTLHETMHPAMQLLSGYRKHQFSQRDPTTVEAGVDKLPQSTMLQNQQLLQTPKILANAPADFLYALRELKDQAYTFTSIHEIMQLAIDTLNEHVDMERVIGCLLNVYTKELRTYYHCGTESNPALKNFRHTLQKGDLFNKLLQKPSSIRLKPSNYSQVWPLIPYEFKLATDVDEFFMMSVFDDDKPVALLYADRGNSKTKLNNQQYQYFKQLCHAVSHCIKLLPKHSR